ncbi:MAG: helix-turn-helix transcriptional regulator [Clostridia bacterium]|nr:helix-turn-helix transcriptional regulator [Clostridia bacterium]
MLPRLKKLRKGAQLTQKQLADVLQVSQQSINKYENHDVQPDLETLIQMADYFKVSVDYLIGSSDSPRRFSLKDNPYTEDEMYFLSLYDQLSEAERESIRLVMLNYCNSKK